MRPLTWRGARAALGTFFVALACGLGRAAPTPSLCLDLSYLQGVLADADSVDLTSARQRLLADTLRQRGRAQLAEMSQGPVDWIKRWDLLERRETAGESVALLQPERESLLAEASAAGWATRDEGSLPAQRLAGAGLEEALIQLLEAYRANPWNGETLDLVVEGYAQLGRVYRTADILDQCLVLFSYAIERKSRTYFAHYQLGSVLRDQGRPLEALVHLYEAEEQFLHAVEGLERADGRTRDAGFRGIPRIDEDAGDPARAQYSLILAEQYNCEFEAGLGDNAIQTLSRLALYEAISEEDVEQRQSELRWGGTPESRVAYQQAQEAEKREDFVLAAELYARALEGVRTPSEEQRVTYDLAYVTYNRLYKTAEGIEQYRRMLAIAPLGDGENVPADTVAVQRLTDYGNALFDQATALDNSGRSAEALALYDELCAAAQPNLGQALYRSALLLRNRDTKEALQRLERLEGLIERGAWGLPEESNARRDLLKATYGALMDIHRKEGRVTQADRYHALAKQLAGS